MSHVVEVDLHVMDLDALKEACQELGLTFLENQKTYQWYGHWVNDYHAADAAYRTHTLDGKCEHAIRHKAGEYEIGVVKSVSGTGYDLLLDEYGSGQNMLRKCGGKGLPALHQRYTEKVAMKHLRKTGHRVVRTVMSDGSIKLTGVK